MRASHGVPRAPKVFAERWDMSMSAASAGEGHAPADRAGEGGTGVLYVVATPIGNLADLGQRARTVLGEVDVVVAEDTRHTGRLLAHHGLSLIHI